MLSDDAEDGTVDGGVGGIGAGGNGDKGRPRRAPQAEHHEGRRPCSPRPAGASRSTALRARPSPVIVDLRAGVLRQLDPPLALLRMG